MKFTVVPGAMPAFGSESIDLTILLLAVPAMLALFLGMRKDVALSIALVFGAFVVLLH